MKTVKIFLLMLLFIVVINESLFAQIEPVKNYKGGFEPVTIISRVDVAGSDSSKILMLPSQIKELLVYYNVDNIETGDTIKNVIVQGSPDKIRWYQIVALNSATAPLSQRLIVSSVDKYIRVTYSEGGSTRPYTLSIKIYPKSY